MSVLGKRKRDENDKDNSKESKKQKKSNPSPSGYCTKTMKRCKCHRKYLCRFCHSIDKKGYLLKLPEYTDEAAIPCSWKDHQKHSYPKHNKRYHNTKARHNLGFEAYPKASNTSKQATISFVNNIVSNENIDNENDEDIDINIQIVEDIDIQIVEEKVSENILYDSMPSVLEIEECVINLHLSPTQKQKQQTLDKLGFRMLECKETVPQKLECKQRDKSYYDSPEYIHFNHRPWSTLKQSANQHHLGCSICIIYDNKKQTMYAEQEYPLCFTTSDFVNKTNQWSYCYTTHRKHPEKAGHQYAICRAGKSNYFNDQGIDTQIEAYLHNVRYREPDVAYTRNLHLVNRTKGYTGNIGLSTTRLEYYDVITHKALKSNVTKQLNKPPPWGGPNPFLTTMDIFSCGTMSTEMHVLFKLLPIEEELTFIAIPFHLSPITSKEGQSKTLKDSAARHVMYPYIV